METMSLKALANKVLQGNSKRNSMETEIKKVETLARENGNHGKLTEEPTESLNERMCIMGENCAPEEVKPYVTDYGILVIPWNSARKYHYWNKGQSVCDTPEGTGTV